MSTPSTPKSDIEQIKDNIDLLAKNEAQGLADKKAAEENEQKENAFLRGVMAKIPRKEKWPENEEETNTAERIRGLNTEQRRHNLKLLQIQWSDKALKAAEQDVVKHELRAKRAKEAQDFIQGFSTYRELVIGIQEKFDGTKEDVEIAQIALASIPKAIMIKSYSLSVLEWDHSHAQKKYDEAMDKTNEAFKELVRANIKKEAVLYDHTAAGQQDPTKALKEASHEVNIARENYQKTKELSDKARKERDQTLAAIDNAKAPLSASAPTSSSNQLEERPASVVSMGKSTLPPPSVAVTADKILPNIEIEYLMRKKIKTPSKERQKQIDFLKEKNKSINALTHEQNKALGFEDLYLTKQFARLGACIEVMNQIPKRPWPFGSKLREVLEEQRQNIINQIEKKYPIQRLLSDSMFRFKALSTFEKVSTINQAPVIKPPSRSNNPSTQG